MLQVKINKTKLISPEGDRLYIKDVTGVEGETTYVYNKDTDAYDAVTNTTGYGVNNGERSSVANFPVGVMKKTGGDEFVEFEGYNPTSSMEYAAIMNEDGRIMTYLVTVPVVEVVDPNSVDEGDAVFYISNMQLLQKINGVLMTIEAEDLLGTSFCSEPYDALFIAHNSLKKGSLMRALVNAMKDPKCKVDVKAIRHDFTLVSSVMAGSVYEFWLGNKLNAQKDIEFLNSYKYIKY